jgi:hypothetical protein
MPKLCRRATRSAAAAPGPRGGRRQAGDGEAGRRPELEERPLDLQPEERVGEGLLASAGGAAARGGAGGGATIGEGVRPAE